MSYRLKRPTLKEADSLESKRYFDNQLLTHNPKTKEYETVFLIFYSRQMMIVAEYQLQ